MFSMLLYSFKGKYWLAAHSVRLTHRHGLFLPALSSKICWKNKQTNTNLHTLKKKGCCGCENQVEAVCPLQAS